MAEQKRLSRRSTALAWLSAVTIFVGVMIYLEAISVLYVVATLALILLLLIVSLADLEKVGHRNSSSE